MSITYTDMTPVQRHFAGRLHSWLESRAGSVPFTIESPAENYRDLFVVTSHIGDERMPGWLEGSIFEHHHHRDPGMWRVWVAPELIEQAGFEYDTGNAVTRGIVLPTDAVDTALMELPEGWTDTGILMALELAGIDMSTTLNHSQLARVIETLTDSPDAERVALWVSEVSGYSHQLNEALDHAEDWVRWEADKFLGHWYSPAEYAEEWVTDYETVPDVLRHAIDWDAVWDELRHDLTYAEDGGEVWIYED